MKKIGIIVPCYNEEENILFFLEETTKTLDEINKTEKRYEFVFYFVNDGSKDNTLNIIKKSVEQSRYTIKYISFSRNFFKESALLAGLTKAQKEMCDGCIIMDADLQDPPELISELIKKWEEGYKHIYTKHKNRKGENFIKKFFALSFYKVYSFLTKDKSISNGARDYSLLDRSVVDAYLKVKDCKRFTKGISSWVGFKKYCIEFEYVPRNKGDSKMNFKRLLNYAFVGINNYSRFLNIIPKVSALVFGTLFVIDTVISICHKLSFLNYYFLPAIRIDLLGLTVSFIFMGAYKVLYDTKEQTMQRPQYLIEEEN